MAKTKALCCLWLVLMLAGCVPAESRNADAVQTPQDDPALHYQLAQTYAKNNRYDEALAEYRKAADAGYAPAQVALGGFYAQSQGAQKDDVKAAEWFRKAAEQGNATGMYYLGVMYAGGLGVPKDEVQAEEWFRKARQQRIAQVRPVPRVTPQLGRLARVGQCPGGDQRAKRQPETRRLLAGQGPGKIRELRRSGGPVPRTGRTGLRPGADHAGQSLQTGSGRAQSDVQAVKWYRKAAEQGFSSGQIELAEAYRLGLGVKKDEGQAAKWYRKAGEQGDRYAKYSLALLCRQGRCAADDEAQAAVWAGGRTIERPDEDQTKLRILLGAGRSMTVERFDGISDSSKQPGVPASAAPNSVPQAAPQTLPADAAPDVPAAAPKTPAGTPETPAPKADAAPLTDCDTLAAFESDPNRKAEGVAPGALKLNAKRALPACLAAVEQYPGSPRLRAQLGRAYAFSRNLFKAAEELRKAAQAGYAPAQTLLGGLYDMGLGVPQDSAQAVQWYQKAVAQGDPNAMTGLGDLYRKGRGVPKDYNLATAWYFKAALMGFAPAQNNLGGMFRLIQNDTEAVKWYRKAADQGDSTAQGVLGDMYRLGKGVGQDYAQALQWYRKAADQGLVEAQRALAAMYHAGLGVAKDEVQAAFWIKKAQTQTVENAKDELRMLEGGLPSTPDQQPKENAK